MGDRIAVSIELQTTLEYQAEQIPLQIIYGRQIINDSK